jgi:hypothetical protein
MEMMSPDQQLAKLERTGRVVQFLGYLASAATAAFVVMAATDFLRESTPLGFAAFVAFLTSLAAIVIVPPRAWSGRKSLQPIPVEEIASTEWDVEVEERLKQVGLTEEAIVFLASLRGMTLTHWSDVRRWFKDESFLTVMRQLRRAGRARQEIGEVASANAYSRMASSVANLLDDWNRSGVLSGRPEDTATVWDAVTALVYSARLPDRSVRALYAPFQRVVPLEEVTRIARQVRLARS